LNLYIGYRHRLLIPADWANRNWLLNYMRASEAAAIEPAINRVGNDLVAMLHTAAVSWSQDLTMIGVSMSDRKLYVGWVFQTPKLRPGESHFSLFPLMSGYRDEHTLQPRFNFFYPLNHADLMAMASADHPFRHLLVLALSDVRSARLLDRNFDPKELSGVALEPDAQEMLSFDDD